MNILIVLVNYKRAEDTIACLQSLASLKSNNTVDIALCDNASANGSVEKLMDYLKSVSTGQSIVESASSESWCFDIKHSLLRHVYFVVAERNGGFAKGNNDAYRIAQLAGQQYEYIWFLNNDTEVEPDCLDALVSRMQSDPRLGICGSTLVYAHDRKTVQVLGGCLYSKWTGLITEIGNGKQWPFAVDDKAIEMKLDYVAGASMLTSKKFLNAVGLMSEEFFLYFEEIDWAERARQAGFGLGYSSQSVVYHKEGASIGTGSSAARSLLAEYYGLKNKLLISRKHFPYALPLVWVLSWLQVMRRISRLQWQQAALMARILIGLGRPKSI